MIPATDYSDLARQFSPLWEPPARLSLSEWSEKNITLSSEYASRSSNLVLFGWQKEIFDAFTDPDVLEITLCCSTQLVKTLYIQCALIYVIVNDPGPILIIQPNDDDARTFSKERLTPMIRDNECLRGLISDSTHDGKNTIVSKMFPGGSLSIVGSISPSNLARRSIRYLFGDEIDLYPLSASKGDLKVGDPMGLAKKRQATFGSRRKLIRCCSPTIVGRSAILGAYADSDQRKPYVPCPACGEFQVLKFRDAKGYRVRWDSSLAPKLQAATAHYHCIKCDAPWTDVQRKAACEKTVWRAEGAKGSHAGFWISHLYSPWYSMSEIVDEFIRAKSDRIKLQVFINTALAEGWQEDGETPDHEVLYGRREEYPFGDAAVIPQRGLFLTSAVDVQDNPPRLEVETVAWGRGRENWSVDYRVIHAFAENGQALPVTSKEVWDKLNEEVLQRNWLHESGVALPIMAMTIDTGSRPKPVYEFARRHPQLSYSAGTGLKLHAVRTVVPIKGTPDPLRIVSSVSKEDAARKRQGVRIIGVGTHCAKQEIYDLLKAVKPSPDGSMSGSPVHGCYHFPFYDLVYFEGLASEVRIVKDDGKVVYEKRGPRNEPLDIKVYNRAAAALVGIDRFNEHQWRQLEEAVKVTGESVVGLKESSSDLGVGTENGTEVGTTAPASSATASAPTAQPPTAQPKQNVGPTLPPKLPSQTVSQGTGTVTPRPQRTIRGSFG